MTDQEKAELIRPLVVESQRLLKMSRRVQIANIVCLIFVLTTNSFYWLGLQLLGLVIVGRNFYKTRKLIKQSSEIINSQ